MFCVYVLRSLKNGRFYIGHTNDLSRRFTEHNNSNTQSTRYMRPWELVYKEEYLTNLEAARRERVLKTGQGREWLKKVLF